MNKILTVTFDWYLKLSVSQSCPRATPSGHKLTRNKSLLNVLNFSI